MVERVYKVNNHRGNLTLCSCGTRWQRRISLSWDYGPRQHRAIYKSSRHVHVDVLNVPRFPLLRRRAWKTQPTASSYLFRPRAVASMSGHVIPVGKFAHWRAPEVARSVLIDRDASSVFIAFDWVGLPFVSSRDKKSRPHKKNALWHIIQRIAACHDVFLFFCDLFDCSF